MKHYRILSAEDEDLIAEWIQEAINDGWELIGDLQVKYDPREYNMKFYQSIGKIKREVCHPTTRKYI